MVDGQTEVPCVFLLKIETGTNGVGRSMNIRETPQVDEESQ